MTKQKKGLLLALIGLLIGIAIGFGILGAKHILKNELIALLDGEAQIACNCNFEVDTVDISLLSLTARAENGRLTKQGENQLIFKKIRAEFSLKHIMQGVIDLKHLYLIDGHSEGALPGSATYEFIDYLSTPIAPEELASRTIQLKLHELSVQSTTFTEAIANYPLIAEGAALSLERAADDSFVLRPYIESLKLYPPSSKTEAILSAFDITTKVRIKDNIIDLKELLAQLNQSWVKIDSSIDTDKDNALNGELSGLLNTVLLTEDKTFSGAVDLKGSVGDTLEEPLFSGKMTLNEKEQLRLTLNKEELARLNKLDSDFIFRVDDEGIHFDVKQLRASGKNISVSSEDAVSIHRGEIESEIYIDVKEIEYADVKAIDLQIKLNLSGDFSNPELALTGKAEKLHFDQFDTPPVNYEFKHKDKRLHFNLFHNSGEWGDFKADGELDLSRQVAEFRSSNILLDNFKILKAGNNEDPELSAALHLSGEAKLSGPSSLEALQSKGSIILENQHFAGEAALQGTLALDKGLLEIQVNNQSRSIAAAASINFKEEGLSSLSLDLSNFKAKEYYPDLSCFNLGITSTYEFSLNNPYEGNGQIDLNELLLGCKPYEITLKTGRLLKIQKGKVIFNNLILSGNETSLTLNGDVGLDQSLNLSASGTIFLNSLLDFTPQLDDLRGIFKAETYIQGSFSEPLFKGTANIINGEFAIEAENLSASQINGKFNLSKTAIEIIDLQGKMNEGAFSFAGELHPFAFERSQFNLKADEILILPYENTSVVLSGDVEFLPYLDEPPLIKGEINIDSAEFQQDFNLFSLIRSIPTFLFSEEKQADQRTNTPDINLDLSISASRNLFITTTFLKSELKGSVLLRGSLADPRPDGRLETLTGWFGLKDRPFDITSGIVEIKPGYQIPQLQLVAESTVRGRTGEEVFVILEASGPITSPTITLSSDQGYSEQEIIALISAGGNISDYSFSANRIGEFEDSDNLLQDLSSFNLRRLVRGLTRIDRLAIEPTFNPRRGTIEPALIAEKNISRNITAIGQSFLSDVEQDSKLVLRYQLRPDLALSGIADTADAESNTILGVDLAYSVLSRHAPYLKIVVTGNSALGEDRILSDLKLSPSSRIPAGDTTQLKTELKKLYKDYAYFNAKADVVCKMVEDMCRELHINVDEGKLSTISKIHLPGDSLPPVINIKEINKNLIGREATEKLRTAVYRRVLRALRSEGYIGARIDISYQTINQEEQELIIEVKQGQPVSFTFVGNKAFSAEEFLQTINLFNRKQPFGKNTINILARQIEKKYRQAGYLMASIDVERSLDTERDRINYLININEETITPVASVSFKGLNKISELRLKELIETLKNKDEKNSILNPKFAVAEELAVNSNILRKLLIEEGFPNAQVSYHIKVHDAPSAASISYEITEGAALKVNEIKMSGWPDALKSPAKPQIPYSIPKANRYTDLLYTTLRDNGFYAAEISTDFAFDTDTLIITVSAGPQATISKIIITGNTSVPGSVILEKLTFNEGDPWLSSEIEKSRRNLLTAGLFSRATLRPNDNKIDSDSEELLVMLDERALQTLEVGTGISSEYGLHFFGEGTDKTLFADGRALSLRVDTFYDDTTGDISRGVANFRFSNPNVNQSEFVLTEDLRFARIELSTYEFDLDRTSIASYLSKSTDNNITYSFGHTALQENLDNVSPGAILTELDTGVVELSFLSGNLRYDKRNNPLKPTSGYSLGFDYALASEYIGSDANYLTTAAETTAFYPAYLNDHRIVLAWRSRVANGWTFDGTRELPISQRYYLGGRSSIRGFRENSLGPRAKDGSVIGGDLLIANNFELRYLLGDVTSFHVFFDVGSVFLDNLGFNRNELRRSAGVGLRYLSPIGPIGIDIGHPLDERPGEPSLRFHFVIGSNF